MNARRDTASGSVARMVLALDALNCEARLIETAAALAAALGAELDVLFVEDADLYAAAELSITQEISLASAREREFSAGSLTAALGALAREAERRFRATAPGHFRITRAPRAEALSAVCGEVDLLLLPAQRTLVRVLVHAANGARLAVLCGSTEASARVLDLAARLARRAHRAIEVVTVGSVEQPRLAMLEHAGVRLGHRELPAETKLEQALAAVDDRPGNTLLVAADLPLAADRARLLEALSRLRCQSLVVN